MTKTRKNPMEEIIKKLNNLRVFQIQKEISGIVQGERTVQEYATELERLWLDHDYFSPLASCKDSECKEREASLQKRTMSFLRGLAPAYEQRTTLLLTQTKFPPLEKAVSAMIQEESRIRLRSGIGGLRGEKSALVVSNPDNTRFRRETRQCFNCGEVGHLRQMCPKPPKERNWGERGQTGGHAGRGGRGRVSQGIAHLAVADESQTTAGMTGAEITELEELCLFKLQAEKSKGKGQVTQDLATTTYFGNFIGYAHATKGTQVQTLKSTKTHVDWIIDSGASRHVTGTSSEFALYYPSKHMHPETVQTADGTSQPIRGTGSVHCTLSVTLSSVLHVPSFPVNLLSVSFLIDQLNCTVLFDRDLCLSREGNREEDWDWHQT
ncbi:uncharacterized protein LOC109825723 [Asparagus officinalis]|uniref:uncharacterized protein LOC109825723 n=1 Tax=Asparagus officinalis TaxID=4686 RepID=UPI00098E538B|nr:uncharacterized protein LOC109825723 [Asparagus officinalis]